MNGWHYPNTDGPKFMEIQIPSVIVRFVESLYLFSSESRFWPVLILFLEV